VQISWKRFSAFNWQSKWGKRSSFDGGHKIKSVKVIATANGKSTEVDAKYLITDTRMQVFLPQGLNAKGGLQKIKNDFSFIALMKVQIEWVF
jgi:hypothetical protein